VATGVGSVIGNKGGLLTKLEFGSTSMCFVSSHLAAHSWKLKNRNKDGTLILQNTLGVLGTPELEFTMQFDHVFWVGDLNYRIDMQLGGPAYDPYNYAKENEKKMRPAVDLAIANQDWATLMEKDQLRYCQANGEAFVGFTETDPTFAPTFKLERKAGFEYKGQRIPSYTDRILWKSMPPLKDLVVQTEYSAVPAVGSSDHKPVIATFEVQPTPVITPIKEKYAKTQKPFPILKLLKKVKKGRKAGGAEQSADTSNTADKSGASAASSSSQSSKDAAAGKAAGIAKILEAGRAKRAPCDESGAMAFPAPLVRLQNLIIDGALAADIDGSSDPYLMFFTNPPGLLMGGTPISAVKKALATSQPGKNNRRRSTVAAFTASLAAELGKAAKAGEGAQTQAVRMHAADLPLLRVLVSSPAELARVTMIVAVYDHDDLSSDDYLGAFSFPLGAPPDTPADETNEYHFDLDEPLLIGNVSKETGTVRAQVTISGGDRLSGALTKAEEDGVGTKASTRKAKSKLAMLFPCL